MVRSFVGDPEGRMTLGRGTTARAAHTGGGTSVQDVKKNYRDENRKTMSLQLSQTQKTGSSGSGVKALVADMQQKIAEHCKALQRRQVIMTSTTCCYLESNYGQINISRNGKLQSTIPQQQVPSQ